MCRPNTNDTNKAHPKQDRYTRLSRYTTIAACIGALFFAAVPFLLSELVGGWARKYTSPRPIFTASSIGDMTGKVAIVTGSNTGVGYVTALELARNGAEVIVASRNPSKGEKSVARIQESLAPMESKVRFLQLDLSSLASVEQFTSQFQKLNIPLDVLVLNAGIMKSPGAHFVGKNFTYGFKVTQDGFEEHIGVNHIGHFYLTQLLTEKLKESAPSRVVAVSSIAESGSYKEGIRMDLWRPKDGKKPSDYEDGAAYGQSKLANLLFARELAERMEGTNVTAYSCHPGVVKTDLFRYMEAEMDAEMKCMGKVAQFVQKAFAAFFYKALFEPEDGALSQLHVATSPTNKLANGGFYHPIGRLEKPSHPEGMNVSLQKTCWEETEKAIKAATKIQ